MPSFFINIKRKIVFMRLAILSAQAIPFPPKGLTRISTSRMFEAKLMIPAVVGSFVFFWA